MAVGDALRRAGIRAVLTGRLDDPKHQVHDLVTTRFAELNPRFSPDGAWVAYLSNESGRFETYVVDSPNATRKLQVSRDVGGGAIWSLDGAKSSSASPRA